MLACLYTFLRIRLDGLFPPAPRARMIFGVFFHDLALNPLFRVFGEVFAPTLKRGDLCGLSLRRFIFPASRSPLPSCVPLKLNVRANSPVINVFSDNLLNSPAGIQLLPKKVPRLP